MKDTLKPGLEAEQTITTTPEMGITHLGPDAPRMYSTPAMIGLMEGTCLKIAAEHLDPGEQTVGARVDVRHLAPTRIGQKVTVKARLREVQGRRLFFDVAAYNEDGTKIGEGMHERAVIDVRRFIERG